MSSRSAIPTALPSSTAERRGSPRERSGQARDTATDHVACRPLSGLAYAARCHAGQRRESDGAPFIEHLSEVARLLRDAGCADVLVAAGLLHSVLQDTDISALADEIRRERARVGAYATHDRARGSLERYQQMRVREYHASQAMLRAVAPQHRLVRQLASELDRCPISIRRARHVSAGR